MLFETHLMYDENNKKSDKKSPYFFYILRPFSFLVTPLFLKLGISANQTTAMRFLVGLLSLYFMQIGSYRSFIIGSVIYLLSEFLDFVDGNIARYHNNKTYVGKYFDGLTDMIVGCLKYTFIGIGIGGNYIIIGLYMSLVVLMSGYFSVRFSNVLTTMKLNQKGINQKSQTESITIETKANINLKSLLLYINMLPSRIIATLSSLCLIVFAALNYVDIWLLGFSFLVTVDAIFNIIKISCLALKHFKVTYE